MEGLVILLGEFLFSLAGCLAAIFGQLILFIASAGFHLVACMVGLSSRRGSDDGEGAEPLPAREPIRRNAPKTKLALKILGPLTILVVILAVLFNTVWFEPSFRWLTKRIAQRTGMRITYAEVKGSYFSGRLKFRDLEVVRTGNDRLNFDFSMSGLDIKLDPLQILSKPVRISQLHINQLEGSVERYREPKPAREKKDADISVEFRLKPRRSFEIDSLRIQDGQIRVRDQIVGGDMLEFDLVVDVLESQPFRGGFAVFDLLFRSNARGFVAERPFELATHEVDGGRSTTWAADALPVSIPRHFIGGPFGYVTNGVIDVDVTDYWRLGKKTEIDMHWALTFREVKAAVPDGLSGFEEKVARAAVGFINKNEADLPLAFDVTINEETFEGAASVKATGLFKVVSDQVVSEIASRLGKDKTELKQDVKEGMGKFRDFLNKKRSEGED